jgi:TRAP-type uncharacterized transport system fused permease subunit
MKRRLFLISLFLVLLFSVPGAAQQLTFMTGPQGGVWVPLGGALKGMWEKAIPGLQVTAIPGAAGIVIGSSTITGLGISFTQFVVALSQNLLPIALLLTAIAGIILGLSLPTTPSYIVMVALPTAICSPPLSYGNGWRCSSPRSCSSRPS